jgi:YHS domain-containing protein
MVFFAALAIGYSSGTSFACGTDGPGCLAKAGQSQALAAGEEEETATDRVCGMDVKKDPDKSIQHEGFSYYFCSKGCMEKFQGDTKKYACPCPDIHTGCNCYHCTGRGGACDCAEEHKKEGEGHHHEGDEEHHH